jgi:hypothetical protein
MTEPEDTTNRIELLRAELSPEAEAFLEEFWLTGKAVGREEFTERDKMSEQARFVQQFGILSRRDRKIIMEVMRLRVLNLKAFDAKVLIRAASRNPGYTHRIVGWAQRLETMEEGKPLRENMNICEAIEVIERHLRKSYT